MMDSDGKNKLTEDQANAFNCMQRGHQNILENWPQLLVMLFASSVFADRALYAAVGGAVRLAGFVFYRNGYATGDPKKRSAGFFGYFGLLAHLVIGFETCYRIISGAY